MIRILALHIKNWVSGIKANKMCITCFSANAVIKFASKMDVTLVGTEANVMQSDDQANNGHDEKFCLLDAPVRFDKSYAMSLRISHKEGLEHDIKLIFVSYFYFSLVFIHLFYCLETSGLRA